MKDSKPSLIQRAGGAARAGVERSKRGMASALAKLVQERQIAEVMQHGSLGRARRVRSSKKRRAARAEIKQERRNARRAWRRARGIRVLSAEPLRVRDRVRARARAREEARRRRLNPGRGTIPQEMRGTALARRRRRQDVRQARRANRR